MKVVLKEDIEGLGKFGSIVEVAKGYGRNYLLPRKLAMLATPGEIKMVQEALAKRAKELEKRKKEVEAVADKIKSIPVIIEVKVGQEDKMFGSVTAADIAEALAKQNISVDVKKIRLEEPIKSLGNYTVSVKLHQEVVAEIPVQVVKSDATE